jgi:hypothetical protein
LLLATGELTASVPHVGIDTVLSHFLIDEVPSVGRLQSIDDLLVSGGWVSIEQVVLDRGVEKDGFLAHIPNFSAELSQV